MLGSAFFGDQPVTSTQSPERARTRTEESSWAGSAGLVSGGAAAWCSVQLGNISSPGGNVGSSGSDSVRVAAMRFPSSRKYLWDRTPQGALTYVQFTEHLPLVDVAQDVLGAARSAMQSSGGAATHLRLCARVAVDATGRRLTLTLSAPLSSSERAAGLEVLCQLSGGPPVGSLSQSPSALHATMRGHLNRRGGTHLWQLFASACALQLRPDGTACLAGTLLLPGTPLSIAPLATKRVCDSHLAQQLASPCRPGAAPEDGLLTMDAARSLVPLSAGDAQVFSVPLVGAWVRGVRSLDHPLVAVACLRFGYSDTLPDRARAEGGSFLLLMYPPEGCSLPRCYEARFHDSDSNALTLLQYGYQGELLQLQGGAGGRDGEGVSPHAHVGASVRMHLSLDPHASPATLTPRRGTEEGGTVASATAGRLSPLHGPPSKAEGGQQGRDGSPAPAPRTLAVPTPMSKPPAAPMQPRTAAWSQQHPMTQTHAPLFPHPAPPPAGHRPMRTHSSHPPTQFTHSDSQSGPQSQPSSLRHSLDTWLYRQAQQPPTTTTEGGLGGQFGEGYNWTATLGHSATHGAHGAVVGTHPQQCAGAGQGVQAAPGFPDMGSASLLRRSTLGSSLVRPLYNPLAPRASLGSWPAFGGPTPPSAGGAQQGPPLPSWGVQQGPTPPSAGGAQQGPPLPSWGVQQGPTPPSAGGAQQDLPPPGLLSQVPQGLATGASQLPAPPSFPPPYPQGGAILHAQHGQLMQNGQQSGHTHNLASRYSQQGQHSQQGQYSQQGQGQGGVAGPWVHPAAAAVPWHQESATPWPEFMPNGAEQQATAHFSQHFNHPQQPEPAARVPASSSTIFQQQWHAYPQQSQHLQHHAASASQPQHYAASANQPQQETSDPMQHPYTQQLQQQVLGLQQQVDALRHQLTALLAHSTQQSAPPSLELTALPPPPAPPSDSQAQWKPAQPEPHDSAPAEPSVYGRPSEAAVDCSGLWDRPTDPRPGNHPLHQAAPPLCPAVPMVPPVSQLESTPAPHTGYHNGQGVTGAWSSSTGHALSTNAPTPSSGPGFVLGGAVHAEPPSSNDSSPQLANAPPSMLPSTQQPGSTRAGERGGGTANPGDLSSPHVLPPAASASVCLSTPAANVADVAATRRELFGSSSGSEPASASSTPTCAAPHLNALVGHTRGTLEGGGAGSSSSADNNTPARYLVSSHCTHQAAQQGLSLGSQPPTQQPPPNPLHESLVPGHGVQANASHSAVLPPGPAPLPRDPRQPSTGAARDTQGGPLPSHPAPAHTDSAPSAPSALGPQQQPSVPLQPGQASTGPQSMQPGQASTGPGSHQLERIGSSTSVSMAALSSAHSLLSVLSSHPGTRAGSHTSEGLQRKPATQPCVHDSSDEGEGGSGPDSDSPPHVPAPRHRSFHPSPQHHVSSTQLRHSSGSGGGGLGGAGGLPPFPQTSNLYRGSVHEGLLRSTQHTPAVTSCGPLRTRDLLCTHYQAVEEEDENSDSEMEAMLMRKYGIK